MNKPLEELADQELWTLFPIMISPYDPEWESWYLQEERNLTGLIDKESIVRINHIGSTAVFGLAAKPTIDILLEVSTDTDTSELVKKLRGNGYLYTEQPDNPPPHMMFLKGYTADGYDDRVFHLHIRYPGDWSELYFRDYLRRHKPVADRYAGLKKELAAVYEHDRDGYTKSKAEFIKKYTAAAREELKGKYAYKPRHST